MEEGGNSMTIRELVADQVGVSIDKITPDATFDELGLDSLDLAELLQGLRTHVGEISDKVFLQCSTVSDLERECS